MRVEGIYISGIAIPESSPNAEIEADCVIPPITSLIGKIIAIRVLINEVAVRISVIGVDEENLEKAIRVIYDAVKN